MIVEIADTPYKQSKGLMFRKSLDQDSGMLFKFDEPEELRFWNLNTFIPLDIAFVNENGRITQISHIKPQSPETSFRPQVVVSKEECPYAIETNAGYFTKNDIGVGSKIDVEELSGKGIAKVNFIRQSNKISQQLIDKPDEIDPYERTDIYPQNEDNQNNLRQFQETTTDYQHGVPVLDIDDISSILEDSYDEEISDEDQDQIYEPPSKLEVSPDSEDYPPLEEPQEPFPVPEEDEYPEFDSTIDAMTYAELENETMRIWYQTKRGRDIERSVEPHGQFIAETTGNHILVTFDRTVGDIRAFIIDNILHYNFEGDDFQRKFFIKQ